MLSLWEAITFQEIMEIYFGSIRFQQPLKPTGESSYWEVDFYGVLLHEIFHCLGFWGSSEEWISRVETRDGFHYFVGDKVEEILGGD